MSVSKFKRVQKKSRWAETGTAFSDEWKQRVDALAAGEGGPALTPLGACLQRMAHAGATVDEVAALRKARQPLTKLLLMHPAQQQEPLSGGSGQVRDSGAGASQGQAATTATAAEGEGDVQGGDGLDGDARVVAALLLAELLFFDDSRPLHREVLAALQQAPGPVAARVHGWVRDELSRRLDQALLLGTATASSSNSRGGGGGNVGGTATASSSSSRGGASDPSGGVGGSGDGSFGRPAVLRGDPSGQGSHLLGRHQEDGEQEQASIPARGNQFQEQQQQQQQQEGEAGAAAGGGASARVVHGVPLAGVLLSLLSVREWRGELQACAPRALLCLSRGVARIIELCAPPASVPQRVVEEAADVMGGMYKLIQLMAPAAKARQQLHGAAANLVAGQQGEGEGGREARADKGEQEEAVTSVAMAMLTVLQSNVFPRESLASAGVALWAALSQPTPDPARAARLAARGLFSNTASLKQASRQAGAGAGQQEQRQTEPPSAGGVAEQALAQQGRRVEQEMQRFTRYGRICAAKGIVSSMSAEVFCTRLVTGGGHTAAVGDMNGVRCPGSGDTWVFATDGALRHFCDGMRNAVDAHCRYHAVHGLATTLERIRGVMQAAQSQAAPCDGGVASDAHAASSTASDDDTVPVDDDADDAGSAGGGGAVPAATWVCLASQLPFVSHSMVQDILSLLWVSFEDPLTQTAANSHLAFEMLLDVLDLQQQQQQQHATAGAPQQQRASGRAPPAGGGAAGGEGDAGGGDDLTVGIATRAGGEGDAGQGDDLIVGIARSLLAMEPARKGKYVPLAALCRRLGAARLLQLHPGLVEATIRAMVDGPVCTAAAALLAALLEGLHQHCREEEHGAGAGADERWRAFWVPPLLRALCSPSEALRGNASLYALPVPLRIDGLDSMGCLFEELLLPPAMMTTATALCQNGEEEQKKDVASSPSPPASSAAATVAGGGGGNGCDGVRPIAEGHGAAALVMLLKTARGMAMWEDLQVVPGRGGRLLRVPPSLLEGAVLSSCEPLRVDALSLAACSPRRSALPSALELHLMRKAIGHGMRCSSVSMRNKWNGLIPKLLERMQLGVAGLRNEQQNPGGRRQCATSHRRPKARAAPLAEGGRGNKEEEGQGHMAEHPAQAVERCNSWLQWLTRTCLSSLYPSAPHERRFLALQLLNNVLDMWGGGEEAAAAWGGGKAQGEAAAAAAEEGRRQQQQQERRGSSGEHAERGGGGGEDGRDLQLRPFCEGFFSAGTVTALLGVTVDSWDRLRVSALRALLHLPSPLPGLERTKQLEALLRWACELLRSPRMRESDAGALLLQAVFIKYVRGLGWTIALWPQVSVQSPATAAEGPTTPAAAAVTAAASGTALGPAAPVVFHVERADDAARGRQQQHQGQQQGQQQRDAAVLSFLQSLEDLLQANIDAGRKDLYAACRSSLAHGTLLTLRYVIPHVPWPQPRQQAAAAAAAAAAGMGRKMEKEGCKGGISGGDGHGDGGGTRQPELLRAWVASLLGRLMDVSNLTIGVVSKPQDVNVGADEVDEGFGYGAPPTEEQAAGSSGSDDDDDSDEALGPQSQVLISGCWMSMKEVSLVLATLARYLPCPAASGLDTAKRPGNGTEGPAPHPVPTTTAAAAATAAPGNGRATGGASSSSGGGSNYGGGGGGMLDEGQLRMLGDHFVRCMVSVKHTGAMEKTAPGLQALAERALHDPRPWVNALPGQWLDDLLRHMRRPGQCRDDIVRRSAGYPFAMCAIFAAEPVGSQRALLRRGMAELLRTASDSASSEPWARCHALNCLRMLFSHRELAMDSSGALAQGVQVAVLAMGAGQWDVRNSAALAFSSLITRLVGARNSTTKQAASSRHSMTGEDLFGSYPALHPFLLRQLGEASRALRADAGSGAMLHPSLHPSLLLLARLRPSFHTSGSVAETPLSPAAFRPLVQRCCSAGLQQVRCLAAAALCPLVPPQELPGVVGQLGGSLPSWLGERRTMRTNEVQGVLLQLRCLLETNLAPSTAGEDDVDDALRALLPHLPRVAHLMAAFNTAGYNSSCADAIHPLALPSPPPPSSLSGGGAKAAAAGAVEAGGQQPPPPPPQQQLYSSSGESARLVAAGAAAAVVQQQQQQQHAPAPVRSEAARLVAAVAALLPRSSEVAAVQRRALEHASGICTQQLLASLEHGAGQGSGGAYMRPDAFDPGWSVWLKQMTALYCRLYGAGMLQLRYEHVSRLAAYPGSYEVRATLPKELAKVYRVPGGKKAGAAAAAAATTTAAGDTLKGGDRAHVPVPPPWLAELLWRCCEQETHGKTVRRLLHLLAHLPSSPRVAPTSPNVAAAANTPGGCGGGSDGGSGNGGSTTSGGAVAGRACSTALLHRQRWRAIDAVAARSTHPEVRENALRCVASLAKPLVRLLAQRSPPVVPTTVSTAPAAAAADTMAEAAVHHQVLPVLDTKQEIAEAGELLQQMLRQVADLQEPWRLTSQRLAAADALRSSGLLEAVRDLQPCEPGGGAAAVASDRNLLPCCSEESALGGLVVQAWASALELMEDEEEEVRCHMTAAALHAIAACGEAVCRGDAGSSSRRSRSGGDSGEAGPAMLPGLQAESVERVAVMMVARRLGHLPSMQAQLLLWAYPPRSLPNVHRLLAAAAAQAAGTRSAAGEGHVAAAAGKAAAHAGAKAIAAAAAAAAGRLFDREADNQHHEAALLSHLAASALLPPPSPLLPPPSPLLCSQQTHVAAAAAMAAAETKPLAVPPAGVQGGEAAAADAWAAPSLGGELVAAWGAAVLRDLRELLGGLLAVQQQEQGGGKRGSGGNEWHGGVLSRPAVFGAIYPPLFALWLLAGLPGEAVAEQRRTMSGGAHELLAQLSRLVSGAGDSVQPVLAQLLSDAQQRWASNAAAPSSRADIILFTCE